MLAASSKGEISRTIIIIKAPSKTSRHVADSVVAAVVVSLDSREVAPETTTLRVNSVTSSLESPPLRNN